MSLIPTTNADDSNSLPMLMCNILDVPGVMDSQSIEGWMNHHNIYRIPLQIYQEMYGFAQQSMPVEHKQAFVRKLMQKWIEEEHPDKELANFCDLSAAEAVAVHPHLSWGMWIYLLPKHKALKGIWEQLDERPVATRSTVEDWFSGNAFDHSKIDARLEELRKYFRTEQQWAIGYDPYRKGEDTNPGAVQVYEYPRTPQSTSGTTAKLLGPAQEHLPTEEYLFSGMTTEEYRQKMLGENPNPPED